MIVKADQPDQPSIDLEAMPPWRCSSERYLDLIDSGKLGPDDKVELINGIITAMSPAGPKHDYTIMQLTRHFAPLLDHYDLLIQGTVHISSGQIFDPDLAIVQRYDDDTYKQRHPQPSDIPLIIEAAVSSMKRDAQIKMPIYALAGIPEYWIADIENETLIVHRDPTDSGYGLIRKYTGETAISPVAVQGPLLTPAAIFG